VERPPHRDDGGRGGGRGRGGRSSGQQGRGGRGGPARGAGSRPERPTMGGGMGGGEDGKPIKDSLRNNGNGRDIISTISHLGHDCCNCCADGVMY
jgi:hypothetical protein